MTENYTEEMMANIARAEESIQAAGQLAANGFYDFAASRAYYAAFYAATAVLLAGGLEYGKHSAVIAAIHKELVRTGKLDKQCGRDLNWLFELRSVGDYGVTVHIPKEDAEEAVRAAERFLAAVKEIIEEGSITS
jgi:uncharacterized protein (UPF0332 family)